MRGARTRMTDTADTVDNSKNGRSALTAVCLAFSQGCGESSDVTWPLHQEIPREIMNKSLDIDLPVACMSIITRSYHSLTLVIETSFPVLFLRVARITSAFST